MYETIVRHCVSICKNKEVGDGCFTAEKMYLDVLLAAR